MCNRISILMQLVQSVLPGNTSQWSSELRDLATSDQVLRGKWSDLVRSRGGWEMPDSQLDFLRHEFIALECAAGSCPGDMFGDRFRQARVMQIVKEIDHLSGWLTLQSPDWSNLWLLVQHMDEHIEFQKSMLNIFLSQEGEMSSHYQYLADRISCHEFGTQKYGTQCICEMQ